MESSLLVSPQLARRSLFFQPSPIQQLSRLAQNRNAINLAEGFPDFPAPVRLKQAAVDAISADHNQYRHVEALCEMLAESYQHRQGMDINPDNVTLCCGQSEAFTATVLSVVDVGDEVIIFDPAYETYGACIVLAGGIPVYVPLEPPHWNFSIDKIESRITSRTKAIVLNSPHNPTGKVFSSQELSDIANLCKKHNLLAITDEVYEHITYGLVKHTSLASFPEMKERTIITSSMSKTFSVTGWRIGWAVAPPRISNAISNIHVKITDSAPAPFQEAGVFALQSNSEYYASLRKDYAKCLETACSMLESLGFKIQFRPQGSVFVFAELPDTYKKSDMDYVTELIEKAGVALVPGRGFFHNTGGADKKSGKGYDYKKRYIRLAFCKKLSTLKSAKEAMEKCSHVLNFA